MMRKRELKTKKVLKRKLLVELEKQNQGIMVDRATIEVELDQDKRGNKIIRKTIIPRTTKKILKWILTTRTKLTTMITTITITSTTKKRKKRRLKPARHWQRRRSNNLQINSSSTEKVNI